MTPRVWNSTLPARREKPRRKAQETPKGLGAASMHRGPFRSSELRFLAGKAPKCFCCGMANNGTVVAAHWRGLAYGAGTGLKSPDCLVAFVCGSCHDQIDQRTGRIPAEDRFRMWADAHCKTFVWLFNEGFLLVAA